MLWLLPALVLLGALADPAAPLVLNGPPVAGLGMKQQDPTVRCRMTVGTSTTCPACSFPGNCRETICPPAKDSCLLRQMQLENEILIKNGSCVAPRECREGVYALTYAPNSSLSTACCENNCSKIARPEEAPPNGVKCHYCSGSKSAPCDSLSVMSCTGHQTVCVTLKGTWTQGGPPVLKGCATPALCNLQVNSTMGPEAFGFHLTTPPECYSEAPTTQPGPRAISNPSKAKATTCFTCSDSDHCHPFSCPAERNYCLRTVGILALAGEDSVSWRNGSCVASVDCKIDYPISALTYNISFGFWVNTTCCQGSCQEPTPLATLPASGTLSKFLCPTCADSHPGRCNSSLYMQCPSRETTCVQLDLVSEEGGGNLSVRGCGSRDLCSARDGTEWLRALPGRRLAGRPDCSSSERAVIASTCSSGAAPAPRLALPALVALAARALAWQLPGRLARSPACPARR